MLIRYFLLLCCCMHFIGAQAQEDSIRYRFRFNQDYDYSGDTLATPSFNPDSLLAHACKHIGTVYKSNGKEPGGFDCSGFTFYNFKRFGIFLPYYSFQQAEVGMPIEARDARKGDLILFKGHDLTAEKAGHVGIVYEVKSNRIRFIHASTSQGVKLDFADTPYFKERFLVIRRVVE